MALVWQTRLRSGKSPIAHCYKDGNAWPVCGTYTGNGGEMVPAKGENKCKRCRRIAGEEEVIVLEPLGR